MSTAYSATVSGSLAGAVLVITLDHPPVNAVSADMRRGLLAALEAAAGDDRIAAVVLTGAGANFVAGADIREMGVAPAPPHLPDVLERIERSAKPVVAALQGATLGGGCEIALAAHVRLAAANTQIGLPEVKLGIVPGAGGTQRLPRRVGTAAALDLITSGRSVTAAKALELGLIDGIAAPGELVAEACAMALALAGQPLRRTGDLSVPAGPEAPQLKLRSTAQREAARLIRDFAPGPLATGLAEERHVLTPARQRRSPGAAPPVLRRTRRSQGANP